MFQSWPSPDLLEQASLEVAARDQDEDSQTHGWHHTASVACPTAGATARHFHVKSLGFDTYDEVLARSVPVGSNDGKTWYATSLRDGSWAAWNETELQAQRHFRSQEEAVTSIPRNVEPTGSALLG